MLVHSRKILDKVLPAGAFFLCLVFPATSLAGSNPVVTVGDSSAGGAVNFEPLTIPGSGSVVVVGSSGMTAASIAIALGSGSLGQDQIASGFGSGGVVVTLSEQVSEKVQKVASGSSVVVDGQSMTLLDALLALSTSPGLGNLRVTMPSGVALNLSSVISNVTVALTSKNPTLIGTALNDAAIALSQALKAGENSSDLQSACAAIADLLDVARNS